LFDDDEKSPKIDNTLKKGEEAPKRKYLDQNWKLSPEDTKEFKGFPKKAGEEPAQPSTTAKLFPLFSVLYKFRREYLDTSIDALLADHRGHCSKFKRLINSEVINMGTSKGVVMLWAGMAEDDKEATRAEIMLFLEDDPLIVKDAIEKWDLVDFSKKKGDASTPPLPETVVA
jgi:hypothetical protein